MTHAEISVVNAYNTERCKLGKHPVRLGNEKTSKNAQQYLTWCENHSVPPIEFLRAVIQGTGKVFALGRTGNTGSLKMWDDFLRSRQAAKRGTQILVTREARHIRNRFKIRPAQEKFKSRHVNGKEDLCMVQAQYSGGWNPNSGYCQRCPHQVGCKGS